MKGDPRPEHAIDPRGSLPTEQVHELLADREPLPRAATTPPAALADLGERVEPRGQRPLQAPTATVPHGDLHGWTVGPVDPLPNHIDLALGPCAEVAHSLPPIEGATAITTRRSARSSAA